MFHQPAPSISPNRATTSRSFISKVASMGRLEDGDISSELIDENGQNGNANQRICG